MSGVTLPSPWTASFSLLTFVLALTLGVGAYLLRRRSTALTVFHEWCMAQAVFAFAEFQARIDPYLSTAEFWLRLADVGQLLPALLLHFALELTEDVKRIGRARAMAVIYVPTLLFFGVDISADLITPGHFRTWWGWQYQLADGWLIPTCRTRPEALGRSAGGARDDLAADPDPGGTAAATR